MCVCVFCARVRACVPPRELVACTTPLLAFTTYFSQLKFSSVSIKIDGSTDTKKKKKTKQKTMNSLVVGVIGVVLLILLIVPTTRELLLRPRELVALVRFVLFNKKQSPPANCTPEQRWVFDFNVLIVVCVCVCVCVCSLLAQTRPHTPLTQQRRLLHCCHAHACKTDQPPYRYVSLTTSV